MTEPPASSESADSTSRIVGTDPADVATEAEQDAQLRDELTRVQAERDALASQVGKEKRQRKRLGRFRRSFAVLLVVLTAILVPTAATLVWVHRTIFNTERYVATVGPLGSDPAVTNAVATQLTNQIYTAVNPQQEIASALPKRISFLAGPLSNEIKTLLNNALHKVLDSPQFATFWTDANRFAHTQLVAILKGKSTTVTTSGDTVTLNLVPLLNAALQSIQPQISAIVGKDVKLPTISGNELPSAACAKVSSALGRPLPATCGQVPLFPSAKLKTVQQAVTRFDRLTLLALILAPLLFIAALVVSPRRRRTLLQLTISSAFVLIVIRRLTMYLVGRLTAAAKPENRDAAHAIVSTVLDRFFLITAWLLAIMLVVAFIALVTGPYRWARTLRHGVWRAMVAVGTTTAHVAGALNGKAKDQDTRRWIGNHLGALQAGGVVLIGLLLVILSLSPLVVLILAVVLGAYLFVLSRLADKGETDVEVDLVKRPPSGTTVTPSQRRGPLPAAAGSAKDSSQK